MFSPSFVRVRLAPSQLLSAAPGTGPADHDAGNARFAPDGRSVIFESLASNLVAGDTNFAHDIFRRDLVTGEVTRISQHADGRMPIGNSHNARFNAAGTQVVFESTAANLTDADTGGFRDVFVKDLATGEVRKASSTAAGTRANGDSFNGVFSPDGAKVAFESVATNLTGLDTNAARDIFVKTLATGAVTRVSVDGAGRQANGQSSNATFSADGTKLLFESNASNLVAGDTNGAFDLFVKDLVTGAVTRVSTGAGGGEANGHSLRGQFTASGRVVFESTASNLVAGDTNGARDIFEKDLATGAVRRLSVGAAGQQGDGGSQNVTVAGDWIAFESNAATLTAGDTNARRDIFVKNLVTGELTRVLGPGGVQADGDMWNAALSGDGRLVFETAAGNLGAGGAGRDVYLTELQTADVRMAMGEDDGVRTGRLFFEGEAASVTVRALGPAMGVFSAYQGDTGEIRWTFTGGAALDALGAGQTRELSFAVRLNDDPAAEQVVTVTVAGANDAPIVTTDRLTLFAGANLENLAATLLANDRDPDSGDTLTLVGVDAAGTAGSVAFDAATGRLSYAADTAALLAVGTGEQRADSFWYTVRDAHGGETRAQVTLTVLGANTPPLLLPDAVTISASGPAQLWSAVLANDIDSDPGDTLAIARIGAAEAGTVRLDTAARSLTFTPDGERFESLGEGATASTSFTYAVRDRAGAEAETTVAVTVVGVNDAPRPVADAITVAGGGTLALAPLLLANDRDPDIGDTLRLVRVTGGAGSDVAVDAASGSAWFSPDAALFTALGAGATRVVALTYTVADQLGLEASAGATITLTGVNDAPVAAPDTVVMTAGATFDLAALLLANDRDPDAGDTLTIVAATAPGLPGRLSLDAATGGLTYAATSAAERQLFTGERATATLTYTVRDASGATATSTATIAVDGLGLAPREGTAGADNLRGGDAADRMLGLGGNDTLAGGGGADTLDGGDGNDVLDGGAGVDTLVGGAGDDVFLIDDARDTADGGAGWDTARVSAGSYTLGAGMEELVFTGPAGVVGTGNELGNRIVGTAGADRLIGGAGADILIGGPGADSYVMDTAADQAVEAPGDGYDTVSSNVSYTLPGHVEVLRLTGGAVSATGNALDNELYGTSGDNLLDGGPGADRMAGGGGDDTYVVDNAADVVVESSSAGFDMIRTALSNYTIPVYVEDLAFQGTAAVDLNWIGNAHINAITGGPGNDFLRGLGGADMLNGGAGADRLEGGTGADRLRGGAGDDVFVLRRGESSGEQLLDFTGNGAGAGDVIRLEGWGEGTTLTNVGGLDWLITDGVDGATAAIRVTGAVHASDIIFG